VSESSLSLVVLVLIVSESSLSLVVLELIKKCGKGNVQNTSNLQVVGGISLCNVLAPKM